MKKMLLFAMLAVSLPHSARATNYFINLTDSGSTSDSTGMVIPNTSLFSCDNDSNDFFCVQGGFTCYGWSNCSALGATGNAPTLTVFLEELSGNQPTGDPSSPSVPEPSGISLLLLAVALLFFWRRARRGALAAALVFACLPANAQDQLKPDFLKISTVIVAAPSESATSYQYKVDDWPADPNVHEVPSMAISSTWVEVDGWHFLLNCTNRIIATIPCRQIAAGAYKVEWKGSRVFAMEYKGKWELTGTAQAPDRVVFLIPNGKKTKRVSYALDSFYWCDDGDLVSGGSRTCVFYNTAYDDYGRKQR